MTEPVPLPEFGGDAEKFAANSLKVRGDAEEAWIVDCLRRFDPRDWPRAARLIDTHGNTYLMLDGRCLGEFRAKLVSSFVNGDLTLSWQITANKRDPV